MRKHHCPQVAERVKNWNVCGRNLRRSLQASPAAVGNSCPAGGHLKLVLLLLAIGAATRHVAERDKAVYPSVPNTFGDGDIASIPTVSHV